MNEPGRIDLHRIYGTRAPALMKHAPPSIHSLAARRANRLPRHPPSLRPAQPRHNISKLLRRSDSILQRRLGTDLLDNPWDLLICLAQQFTLNGSWRNAVDRGAVSTQLVCQVACHSFKTGFACGVDSQTTERLPCSDGRDVDDSSGFGKMRCRGLDHHQRTLQVRGNDRREVVGCNIAECSGRSDASIVDEDVDDQWRRLAPGFELLDNFTRSSRRGDVDADS